MGSSADSYSSMKPYLGHVQCRRHSVTDNAFTDLTRSSCNQQTEDSNYLKCVLNVYEISILFLPSPIHFLLSSSSMILPLFLFVSFFLYFPPLHFPFLHFLPSFFSFYLYLFFFLCIFIRLFFLFISLLFSVVVLVRSHCAGNKPWFIKLSVSSIHCTGRVVLLTDSLEHKTTSMFVLKKAILYFHFYVHFCRSGCSCSLQLNGPTISGLMLDRIVFWEKE
jgi:hypothetical protein